MKKIKISVVLCTLLGSVIFLNAQTFDPVYSADLLLPDNVKENKVVPEVVPPYKITTRRYLSHFSMQRFSQGNEIRIKILLNSVENTDIEDFALAYDSGNEYRMGNIYGIDHVTFPLYVKVTYRTWNAFHAVQSDVVFEFTINCPGTWNVTLFN